MIVGYFIVATALGGALRYAVARKANRPQLPLGTLLVNVSGSFLLGLVSDSADTVVLVIGSGLIATLTTFSGFVKELSDMSTPLRRTVYLAATLILCLPAAWLGTVL